LLKTKVVFYAEERIQNDNKIGLKYGNDIVAFWWQQYFNGPSGIFIYTTFRPLTVLLSSGFITYVFILKTEVVQALTQNKTTRKAKCI